MKRNLTCIICPKGCALTAEVTEGGVTVTGNTCSKGAEYATNECTNPLRTVTATVRVTNRLDTMVSVKTDIPIPKDKMMAVMANLRQTYVQAPLSIGDVILFDLWGANIVITKAVD